MQIFALNILKKKRNKKKKRMYIKFAMLFNLKELLKRWSNITFCKQTCMKITKIRVKILLIEKNIKKACSRT